MDLRVIRDKRKFIEPQKAGANKSKNAYANLIAFLKIFQIFGVNINYSNNKQKRRSVAFVTKYLIYFGGILLLLWIISGACLTVKNKGSPKSVLISAALYLGAYLMWYYIIQCQSKLVKSLSKLQKLKKLIEISPPEKFILICYLLFILICIFSACSYTYDYDVSQSKEIVRLFTFDSVDSHDIHWSVSFIIWEIYYFVWYYIHFFTCYFALFYIIICRYMMIIITEHVRINDSAVKRRWITSIDCDSCFNRYDAIIETFNNVNSILSFPIFLQISYSFCGMLWVTLQVWKAPMNPYLKDIFFVIFNFILFTATTFAASDVNEADKVAKKSNLKMLRSLSHKNSKQIKESVEILSQMCHSDPFALTAWSSFEFNRGFYLSAIACFATYSLLIVNL